MAKTVSMSNLKKAYRYCRKNGVLPTFYAALERIQDRNMHYEKRIITEEELEVQKQRVWEEAECFSILVPAYETKLQHFHEMIDSVLTQTYERFELIIADASPSDKLSEELQYYNDSRIRYLKLPENRGISGNTNAALEAATGSYIALLDHDDTLEQDALYRMMEAVWEGRTKRGTAPSLLYSDEDKCDGDMTCFYEPHIKGGFNLDLLLSNHYICHFLVMEARLMKDLCLRGEYDGAQDHDLVLRAAGVLREEQIVHIPHILYHWRCHTGSTAENPDSKLYAYDAGRRAVADFCRQQGWNVHVTHTEHLGFFRVEYERDIFRQRTDLAAVGGRILCRGRIAGGAYGEDGKILYEGLPGHFSGYMHRAVLQQDVAAVDLRCCRVRDELLPLLERIRKEETQPEAAALRFGREVTGMGYRILWDPFMK